MEINFRPFKLDEISAQASPLQVMPLTQAATPTTKELAKSKTPDLSKSAIAQVFLIAAGLVFQVFNSKTSRIKR
jgi:hypothetical protein